MADITSVKGNEGQQKLIAETISTEGFRLIMSVAQAEAHRTTVLNPNTHTEAYGNVAFGVRCGYDSLMAFMKDLPNHIKQGTTINNEPVESTFGIDA